MPEPVSWEEGWCSLRYKTKVLVTACAGIIVSLALLTVSLIEQKPLTELMRPPKGADSVDEHLQVHEV